MTISGANAASYFKGTEGSFPEDKPTAAWTLPLIPIKHQGYECVGLYFYTSLCLNGIVFN